MKVGFIGLGQMGSAMAANLVKAGHNLRATIAQHGDDIDWAAMALAVRSGAGLD